MNSVHPITKEDFNAEMFVCECPNTSGSAALCPAFAQFAPCGKGTLVLAHNMYPEAGKVYRSP